MAVEERKFGEKAKENISGREPGTGERNAGRETEGNLEGQQGRSNVGGTSPPIQGKTGTGGQYGGSQHGSSQGQTGNVGGTSPPIQGKSGTGGQYGGSQHGSSQGQTGNVGSEHQPRPGQMSQGKPMGQQGSQNLPKGEDVEETEDTDTDVEDTETPNPGSAPKGTEFGKKKENLDV